MNATLERIDGSLRRNCSLLWCSGLIFLIFLWKVWTPFHLTRSNAC